MDSIYKKVESKSAYEIANVVRLRIYQEWSGPLDGITSLQLSYNKKEIKNKLLQLIEDPVLFFTVQESIDKKGREYYHINYMIYHPFDWADHHIPLFTDYANKKDSHPHDTEQVGLRVNKKTGKIDMVTVSHHSHIFAWNTKPEIIIESHSHAIRPKKKEKLDDSKIYRVYQPLSYRLENIYDWSDEKLSDIKHALKRGGDVSWIDEQFDGDLKNTTATGRYRSQGLQHFPGDILNDPNKLFRIAKRCGR